jgi:hypothetical protein
VSALGHYLEEEGVASVAISLIRPQTENTKGPRALWVPFELGRPLGPPGDPAFQRRVLLAALRMLERRDGPVLLDDFPDDDPRAQPDPDWKPPLAVAEPGNGSPAALAAALAAELSLLQPAYRRWLAERGRTSVGLSGLTIDECGGHIGGWLRGDNPASRREGFSAPLLLRFAIDDVKAYCLEAAAAGGTRPSSRQLGDWLWNHSAVGAALHALREICLASDDERLKLIAGNFIVPAARIRG